MALITIGSGITVGGGISVQAFIDIQYLIVGGGAGGYSVSNGKGGGVGGGGFILGTIQTTAQTFIVTVGAGGTGGRPTATMGSPTYTVSGGYRIYQFTGSGSITF